MNTISKILEQVLLEHVVEKSHMLSEAEKPMYKVGDNVTAWIQGGAPAKYKISGIAHIKVPIGDLKKGDPIYIAKKGNKTFYLTDADMRDPMNEKTLRPNGEVEDGDVLNDINEVDYKGMLDDGEGHIHFVFDNLSQAELMADKIEAKHLGDTDYYEDKGKVYLRVSLSVGYHGKEISNIRKIERMVGMKAQAGSPEIWQADESVNEAKTKRINRNQAKLYEKGLKKVAKSVTFAKAAKQDGNIKLFVNYTKYTERAKLKKAGEALGLTYLSDGRVTNRPSAAPIGGGVLGIQNNWMKFAKES
jgi:hypothetical protein